MGTTVRSFKKTAMHVKRLDRKAVTCFQMGHCTTRKPVQNQDFRFWERGNRNHLPRRSTFQCPRPYSVKKYSGLTTGIEPVRVKT